MEPNGTRRLALKIPAHATHISARPRSISGPGPPPVAADAHDTNAKPILDHERLDFFRVAPLSADPEAEIPLGYWDVD